MKKTLRFLTLGIATLIGITALAVPTLAQDDEAKQKKAEECNKIYNEKFVEKRRTDEVAAYNGAKEYLEKCTGLEPEIETYVKNWVTKYEWLNLLKNFNTSVDKNDFPNIYKYGKDILNKDSNAMAELIKLKVATGDENISTMIKMGYAGYPAEKAKNTAFRNDATNYAKMAIQILDNGKTITDWKPFKDKDDASAWLCFALGYMWREASPKDAAGYFYKSSMYNASIKTSAATYFYISTFYQNEYLRVNKKINDKCVGVPDNDECKALDLEQDAWMDRLADALARAVKLGGTPAQIEDWTKTLKAIFKQRYNTEEGVMEYVNTVQSKPLPDPATEPKPAPVREVKVDAATTTDTKPTTITSTTTTTDVAVGNGNGTTAKGKGTTATTATKTTPAKKAPAKNKGGKKKPK
jgi:hypothetical protein